MLSVKCLMLSVKLLRCEKFTIEQFNIGKADNSTFNTQHSTLRTAH